VKLRSTYELIPNYRRGIPLPAKAGRPAGSTRVVVLPANANSIATMDRMNVLAQEFCTTAYLPLGKPILIGGMTLEPEGIAAADAKADPKTAGRQLYLALRVDAD
jgi:hypothetical protein